MYIVPRLSKALAILAISAASQAASAALVTNGSFEDGILTSTGSQGTMTLPVGSTTMPGWTVINDLIAWIESPNPWSLSASDGDRFLDFTDFADRPPFGGVQQDIVTVVGQTYTLSFDLGTSTQWTLSSGITASAAGVSATFEDTATGLDQWNRHSLAFTANSPSTTISLVGSTGLRYIGLDNVTVQPVPIPAAVWLFGSALVGLGAVKRKKA